MIRYTATRTLQLSLGAAGSAEAEVLFTIDIDGDEASITNVQYVWRETGRQSLGFLLSAYTEQQWADLAEDIRHEYLGRAADDRAAFRRSAA